MKRKIIGLLGIVFLAPVLHCFAAGSFSSQGGGWSRVGKVSLCKPSYSNAYVSESCGYGVLYEKFDGETMSYKVYVSTDGCSCNVVYNPSYSDGKVKAYRRNRNRYENYRGPSPLVIEWYPQKAGPYYLDVSRRIDER